MATAEVKVTASSKAQPRRSFPRRERTAPPTHPGEILLEEFMQPLGLTVEVLAARTGHPVSYVEAVTRQQERVSQAFAFALASVLGTGVDVWLNLQQFTDDFVAKQAVNVNP